MISWIMKRGKSTCEPNPLALLRNLPRASPSLLTYSASSFVGAWNPWTRAPCGFIDPRTWYLWHGDVFQALNELQSLEMDLDTAAFELQEQGRERSKTLDGCRGVEVSRTYTPTSSVTRSSCPIRRRAYRLCEDGIAGLSARPRWQLDSGLRTRFDSSLLRLTTQGLVVAIILADLPSIALTG